MSTETEISVSRQKREWAGSCNACQCRNEETVLVVGLTTLSIRLCDDCAEALAKILTKRLEP